LEHSVNLWEVRPAKFVGENAIDIECVREDDAISFGVIEAERRSRVRGVLARIRIFDRVVATGREDVTRGCDVDVQILRDVAEVCNRFRRDDHITGRDTRWIVG
jgi:hypothetical protein